MAVQHLPSFYPIGFDSFKLMLFSNLFAGPRGGLVAVITSVKFQYLQASKTVRSLGKKTGNESDKYNCGMLWVVKVKLLAQKNFKSRELRDIHFKTKVKEPGNDHL